METKFEYQVSLELTKKIALERLELNLRSRGFLLKYPQIWIAVLLAVVGGATSFVFLRIGEVDYKLTERILSAAIGFAVGFGVGLAIRRAIRTVCLKNACDVHKKFGTLRAVSWNSDGLTIKLPDLESKIGWRIIDTIQIGDVGVYGSSNGQFYFAIPKTVFPPNATMENLVQTWQTGRKQPPSITEVPKP